MDIRDKLAIQRTVLANQRTLLAFGTGALAIAVAGVTLIKFFTGSWIHWAGWGLLPCAALVLIIGIMNYKTQNRRIGQVSE